MLNPLLDRGNAAGIGALDDVFDFFGQGDALLFDKFAALDDIDGDIGVNEGDDIQIDGVGIRLNLEDIFLAHGIAAGIFDDGDSSVESIEFQIMIDQHALSGLDVVEHDSVFNFSYIQHSCLLF